MAAWERTATPAKPLLGSPVAPGSVFQSGLVEFATYLRPMALTAEAAFFAFDDRLELSGNYEALAADRAEHLMELLGDDFDIVEAFPSGSIPRGTAVSGLADLDVIVVLEEWEWRGELPSDVLQRVRDCLGASKTNVRKNGQAVTLNYKSWPKVDVVPAGRVLGSNGRTNHLLIPNMHDETWIKSKPRLHSRTIEERTDWSGFRFLDIIRMLKWWNYRHGGLLQSFHIEVLALRTLPGSLDDYSWPIFKFFDDGAALLREPLRWHGGLADGYMTPKTRTAAVNRMRAAATKASEAWFLTYNGRTRHREAIEIWQQLFPGRFPSYG